MSLTKATYSMISGASANILDYIPASEHADILAGTSTYDCAAAILAAITELKGSTAGKRIYFPKGEYKVYTQITVSILRGYVFEGESTSSIIKLMNTTGSLFYITNYVRNAFYNLSFVSNVTDGTQTNIGFRLNGTGGGTELLFQNCLISGFGTAIQTKDAVGNDDTVTFYSCYLWSNKVVWDNTNEQAVTWAFNDCQVLFTTDTVFKNPGNYLIVDGGTYINQGTFCKVDAVTGANGIMFRNIHFETTQNFTPPGTPQWLVIGGLSACTAYFKNCYAVGGGAYAGTVFTLKNQFNVTLEDSSFADGVMSIESNFSSGGVGSTIRLVNTSYPTISETLVPANGNLPCKKEIINSKNFSGYSNQTSSTQNDMYAIQDGRLKLCVKNTNIGASTYSKTFTSSVPVNSKFTISALDFYYEDSSGAAAVITLYTDSGKGTKIYEYSKAASPGVKVAHVDIDEFLNVYSLTGAANSLYLEVVPAGDISIPLITMILTVTEFS